jgi:hypothetical protein
MNPRTDERTESSVPSVELLTIEGLWSMIGNLRVGITKITVKKPVAMYGLGVYWG